MAEQHPEKTILDDDADWLDFDMTIIFLVAAFVALTCIIGAVWFFMKRGKKTRRRQFPRPNSEQQPIREPIILAGGHPNSQEPLVVSTKPPIRSEMMPTT